MQNHALAIRPAREVSGEIEPYSLGPIIDPNGLGPIIEPSGLGPIIDPHG